MGDKGTDIGIGAALGGPLGAGVGYLASDKGGGGQPIEPGIPSAIRPLWDQAQGAIQGMFGQTLNPATYNMTPLQGQIQNSASSILGAGGGMQSFNDYISRVLNPNYANPNSNPAMQGVLTSLQDQFTQGLGKNLDMLGSTFGMAGQVPQRSGAFGQQATNLSRQAMGDYTNNVSNALFGQYNQNMSQQATAASQVPQIAQILNSLSGTAALPQQLASQQQQGQLDLTNLPFNMILSLLGQTPLAYPSYSPQTPSGLQQLAGILGPLGQFGSGIGAILGA